MAKQKVTVKPIDGFSFTEKQQTAMALVQQAEVRVALLRGGSRSGKTFLAVYLLIIRALITPKSNHAIFRNLLADVNQTLFLLTFRSVMETCFPEVLPKLIETGSINNRDRIVTFPNGSRLLFFGLEEGSDRILGQEFSTVYVDEISQFESWEIFETLQSRLAEKKQMSNGKHLPVKMLLSCNPPSKSHWSYKLFIEKINPISGIKLSKPEAYVEFHMNPKDNLANLPANYLEDMLDWAPDKRLRFEQGEWGNDESENLFKNAWINAGRVSDVPHTFDRIVVAVDPAASAGKDADESGIVVTGLRNGEGYVLEDCTIRGSADETVAASLKAFDRWGADTIVVEKNNGGDWITSLFKQHRRNISIIAVHASKSKVARAQPISSLYQQGIVHHVGSFRELEDQLVEFEALATSKNTSPDRADALIWGLTHLMLAEKRDRSGSTRSAVSMLGI